MYNPLTENIDPLPTILYYPTNNDVNWYLSNKAKETSLGFSREVLPSINNKLINDFTKLMKCIDTDTYCRIDFRLSSKDILSLSDLEKVVLTHDNTFFIEINPMPTIETGNNFYVSMINISQDFTFYETIKYYNEKIKNNSIHGFILSCAIIKKFISKHKI